MFGFANAKCNRYFLLSCRVVPYNNKLLASYANLAKCTMALDRAANCGMLPHDQEPSCTWLNVHTTWEFARITYLNKSYFCS